MKSVEFTATVENGVIPIPNQYRHFFSDNVKVIVRTEEKVSQDSSNQKKKKIHHIGIDMTGFKFDREEANARR